MNIHYIKKKKIQVINKIYYILEVVLMRQNINKDFIKFIRKKKEKESKIIYL